MRPCSSSSASRDIKLFMDAIDEQLGDLLDVDIESGILTIELDSGAQYILNKHRPNKQIWLSSPTSGAHHFEYEAQGEQWIGTRKPVNLTDLLKEELKAATGRDVDI